MTDYKTIAESNNFIVLDKYKREWEVKESYQSEGDFLVPTLPRGNAYGL